MRRWEALFDVVELDRTSDGVGRAATQMALIENRRAVGTHVDVSGQRRERARRSGEQVIPGVWEIGNPAQTFAFYWQVQPPRVVNGW
jgi:hypothetical protein